MVEAALVEPGQGRGLRDVWQSRFLLRLLVRKEVKVRYRGSALGMVWSYVKPAIQFLVFYIALGVFLGQERSPRNPAGLHNYAIYLFSGIVLINFFTESLGNAARSIVANGGLIKKIYLPRELFPTASVWVSGVHFFPQILILLVACLFVGWRPTVIQLFFALIGFLIVALAAIGLGLFFGAVNVYFRDSENLVDMLLMVAVWVSPVLYPLSIVQKKTQEVGDWGEVVFMLYQANPLTVAVETFHRAFWGATLSEPGLISGELYTVWVPVALLISVFIIIAGQKTFLRLEGRFAQEL